MVQGTMKLTTTYISSKIVITEIFSVLLIFLFVYAATSKLIAHNTFLYTLKKSMLLAPYSGIISWMIPFAELTISILLFIPRFRKLGLLYSGILLCIFTIYIAYMLLLSPHLPCSCGGILKEMTWRQHLVFNVCFTALAFFAWFLLTKNKDFIAINRRSRTPV